MVEVNEQNICVFCRYVYTAANKPYLGC